MVPAVAYEVLTKYFGYKEFRPAQQPVIETLLAGHDCMAIMPTGAGKSICFQVPALLRKGLTLVFTPLISLMKDQVDGLRLQQIPAAYLNSALTQEAFNKCLYEVRSGQIKLLYLAPERLESERFCEIMRTLPISQVIIDEAHCVSQWGHDFRPAYQLIAPFINSLPYKPIVAAFTATATNEVEADMKRLLALEQAKVFITGFNRKNLHFAVVHSKERLAYVLDYVQTHEAENGVIYCATRKDVEKVYGELVKAGIEAGYYHAGLSDEMRKAQQEAYAYDKIKVIVATNAFGMGIDKSNVRYVLHYQMPRNMESYYQEAGRAGRDGAPAECILLYNNRDVMIHRYLIEQARLEPERKRLELERLQQMIGYCFCTSCLRRYILRYFGEAVPWKHCHDCSACEGKGTRKRITREARLIVQTVSATEERYGSGMITELLSGVMSVRIQQRGYYRLPTFGALRQMEERDIKGLIQQLLASGYLYKESGQYPTLSLTEKGERLLAGYGEVEAMMPVAAVGTAQRGREETRRRGAKTGSGQGSKTLFESLRQHRKVLAEAAGVPPYLIFPDTVLIDLASQRPQTMAEFFQIKGVGEAKLKAYGLSFLKVLKEYKEGDSP